jgi:protein-tyrosine phosphatase
VIDLHCHVLSGLGDGPRTLLGSVALARQAALFGTAILVATPRVAGRDDARPELIAERVEALRRELVARDVPVTLVTGAEVAPEAVRDLDAATLEGLCLGRGRWVLVDASKGSPELGAALESLARAGLRPILGAPELDPAVQLEPRRVEELLSDGALCSVTAASLAGRHGEAPRAAARELLERGLVHDVASGACDTGELGPGLHDAFGHLDLRHPADLALVLWLTDDVPRAVLSGEEAPARPEAAVRTVESNGPA